jgi:alpha-galactosidase
MAIKIAFIGAGSITFCRKLIRDILVVPELRDTHFSLHDIDQRNLEMATQLAHKDLRNNHELAKGAKVTASADRRQALADSDYVINCTRIGGLEAFQHDIDIPLKYGVDQCVGDTLCAGGIMYAQRNIPAILDFCRDMREVANPNVLFLNYANPMAMNTWAAIEHGKVNTIGLCHGVEGGWAQIADVLGGKYPDDVDGVCAGINHQTWYIKVLHKGRPVTAEQLIAGFEKHPVYSKTEKCRIDVLKRFGYYSTESNGHLSEYLPWYRKRSKDIHRWIEMDVWIHGETGGYLRTCTEGRHWFETDFPQWLNQDDPPISPDTRTAERGSYIIEALETGRRTRTYANMRNDGTIANLPDDCIVETPVFIDQFGISTPSIGDLPPACTATLSASIHVQRMAVRAAVTGDVTLLKQAMLHDPLVGAVCDPDEVWRMADEMLVAQAKWLPQYQHAMPAARQRLASSKPPRTVRNRGAARKKVRSIKELRTARELRWLAAADRKMVD